MKPDIMPPETFSRSEKAEMRQIVVLGMHRSGTSATTALINSLGAFVGFKEDLTGQGPENPRGFFERRDLRKICDSLLHSMEADWWKVADLDAGRIAQDVAEEKGRELAGILAELDKHGTWVIKEPRLCLLMPFFRRYLRKPAVVFVVRNPLEVANSLRSRNGFPRVVGLALWEAYCVSALRWSADLPRVVVNYGNLTSEPLQSAAHIYRSLEDIGVLGLKAPDSQAIDPALHRERCDEGEFAAIASHEQKRLWAAICQSRLDIEFQPSISRSARSVLKDFEEDRAAYNRERGEMNDRLRQSVSDLRAMRTHVKFNERRVADLERKVAELRTKLQDAERLAGGTPEKVSEET